MKRLLLAAALLLAPLAAHASNCGAYSYVLTNGQTADANQVMANFNTILNCANNVLAPAATTAGLVSPAFSGTPTTPTGTPGDVSTQIANDAFVSAADTAVLATVGATYAPLASPALTGAPSAPTAAPGTSTTQLATTAFAGAAATTAANAVAAAVAPPGGAGLFFMSSIPTGWLLCDGSAVSRTTYAALYAVIGTTYGVGNGTTTFNLPDARGYFLRGLNTSGGGPDAGRAIGTTQAYAVQAHTHLNGVAATAGVDNPMIYATSTVGVPGLASKRAAPSNTAIDIQGTTSSTGGTETRPVNLAIVIAIHT